MENILVKKGGMQSYTYLNRHYTKWLQCFCFLPFFRTATLFQAFSSLKTWNFPFSTKPAAEFSSFLEALPTVFNQLFKNDS